MAETIDRLQVVIAAQTEDFNKKMEEVNAKLDSLKNVSNSSTSGISSLQSAMTKAAIAGNLITGVVSKAVNGFTGLLKTVVQNGSEFARIKVATETVTKNLGMTTEQVNGLRDSLAESNTYGTKAEEIIKTLAMSGLVDMANGLKVVKAGTDETVEGAGALVYTMKDLAAAAGVESAEGIDRLTKFIRRGEATFADGIVEIGNLTYEYNQYAKSLGKTASELTATERAQVRLDIVMREGEKAYGTYANTMQTSAKAWDSAKAAIRTMTEIVGQYLEPALSVLANGFYQLTSGLRSGLVEAGTVIKQWAQKVAAYFVLAIRAIGSLLVKIPMIGKYFQGMANFSVKPLNSLAKSAGGVSDSVSSIGESASEAAKEMDKLAGFDEMNVLDSGSSGGSGSGGVGLEENMFGASAAEIEDNATTIMNYVDEVKGKFDEFKERLRVLFEPFITIYNAYVAPAVKWLVDTIVQAISNPKVQEFFGLLGGALALAIAGVVTILVGAIKVVEALIVAVVDVSSWTQKACDDVSKWVSEAITNVTNWFNTAINNIKNWIETAIANVKNWFRTAGENIKNWFNQAGENIRKKVTEIKDNIVNKVNDVKNRISEGATQAWNKVKENFGNVGNWFRDRFQTAKNNVINAFQNIPEFFGNLWNRIKEKLSDIGTKAGEVVGSAFKSVINGVLSTIEGVINTPIRAINGLIDTINKVPGIDLGRLSTVSLPRLAQGGIIDNPTVALLGESGREAVVPLENTAWIDELADKINTGGNQNLTIKIGEQTLYEGVIDFINDKSMRTGTKLLNI